MMSKEKPTAQETAQGCASGMMGCGCLIMMLPLLAALVMFLMAIVSTS